MRKLWLLALLVASPAFAQYPLTDAFTGTGGLGTNYTFTSNAGATLSKASGVVTASGLSYAEAYWSANSFTFFGTSNQESTVTVHTVYGDNAGPCVLMNSSGNGYCWTTSTKQISKVTGGFPNGISGYVCPIPPGNDRVALTVQAGVLTCVDITQNGADGITCNLPADSAHCAQITDTTYTTGSPGFIAFNGASVNGTFSADCFPATCGNLPPPTPSTAPGTYGILASVTPTLFGATVACYTLDGSTPTATTFGTCSHGTTWTTGAISLTQSTGAPVVNTINIMATSAANAANSAVYTWVYTLMGVVNTANSPSMGWPVLANGNVTLNSYITFGTANTVTASISGNYGGATGTLDSTAAGNTVRNLTVGPTAGTCTVGPTYPIITANITGGAITSFNIVNAGSGLPASSTLPFTVSTGTGGTGNMVTNSSGSVISTTVTNAGSGYPAGTTYAGSTNFQFYTKITSTAGFNVVFTSVDDPTRTATFPIVVCQNTTQVEVLPFYSVRYSGQPVELQAMTTGNADQNVTWSITAQPTGGNGVIDPSPHIACESTHTCQSTYFSATTAGRYTIQACNADSTCNHATVYVSGNAQPYLVTPNGTEPVDATVDPYGPANGGHTYEVGPSQTYQTIGSAIDFRTASCGDTVRVHNEGPNGTPTSYPEYFSFTASGCRDNPIRLVGVPNASGELPVLEASGAQGPSWINQYIWTAIVNAWGPGCNGSWVAGPAGSCGPNFIVFEGFRLQDARSSFNRYDRGSTTTQNPWPNDSQLIGVHSGYQWVIRGNDLYNGSQSIGTYTPANPLWAGVTQYMYVGGNHSQMFGQGGGNASYFHSFYLQSPGEVIKFNKIENPFPGSTGIGIKTRSAQFVIAYNYIGNGLARSIDHVDIQDAGSWFGLDGYYCKYGDCTQPFPVSINYTNYLFNQYNGLPQMPPAVQAGWHQTGRNQWDIGNVINGSSQVATFHYNHDINGNPQDTYMRGTLHAISNTITNAYAMFDSFGPAGDAGGYEMQSMDAQNNIADTSTTMTVFRAATALGSFGHNLFRTGTVNITSPINICNYNGGGTCGWGDYEFVNPWSNVNPVDAHTTGINSTNFLFTPSAPVDPTTFIPSSGSLAIGQAAAPTGLATKFPVRWQFNPTLGYPTLRTKAYADLGAVDSAGGSPTVVSVAITPAPIAVRVSGTAAATCTATLSDSSTTNCTSIGVWSTTSSNFTVGASTGVVTGVTLSAGNPISVTYSGVTGTGSVNVVISPISQSSGVGQSFGTGLFH